MRILTLTLSLLFCSIAVLAQDNKEEDLKQLRVAEENKYTYIHLFETQDTCLYSRRIFDTLGRVVYQYTNMKCLGWPNYEEVYFEYEGKKLTSMRIDKDGLRFAESTYSYEDTMLKPAVVKTHFFQTHDSTVVENTYYGSDDKVDSTDITTRNQDGSVVYTKTIARYNAKGEAIQMYIVGEDRIPTEMASYEMSDEGLLLSAAFTTYGERSDFTQMFYTYDTKGRLVSSYNTANQKQEFFYLKNGLLKNILNYNPNAELESEYIFEYKYR